MGMFLSIIKLFLVMIIYCLIDILRITEDKLYSGNGLWNSLHNHCEKTV